MSAQSNPPERPFNWPRFLLFVGVAALITAGIAALLVNIVERKQEARNPFYRVVELTDDTEDPAVWGKNFPYRICPNTLVGSSRASGRTGNDRFFGQAIPFVVRFSNHNRIDTI
jgi:hypothetical protein